MTKKEELINSLQESGFIPGEKNDVDARTFNPDSDEKELLALLPKPKEEPKKETKEAKKTVKEPKKEAKEDNKEEEAKEDVVTIKILSNVKMNGRIYTKGETMKKELNDQIKRLIEIKVAEIV
jgi:DNA polymerase II small subunit/DNA polymerase delta subunit B